MTDFASINLDPRANAGATLWVPPCRIVAIAAGGRHNLVLTEDGEVHSSGNNDAGQCDVPLGLSNVVAVGAGYRHSLAVKSDGTVVGWGANDAGQVDVPSGLSNVRSATGGVTHTAALTADGAVFSWGLMKSKAPYIPPVGLGNAGAIASGWWSTCAIVDGQLIAWGTNAEFGFVKEHPLMIGGGTPTPAVTAVALRHDPFSAAIAVLEDGTVMEDRRGDGTFFSHPTEDLALGGARKVIQVAAGEMHRLALLHDGTVVGWGGSAVRETAPVGLNRVLAIAAGSDHALALRADGRAVAWGKNGYKQLQWPDGFSGEFVAWDGDGYYLQGLGVVAPDSVLHDPYRKYGARAAGEFSSRSAAPSPVAPAAASRTPTGSKVGGACYVATAVYGDHDAPPVVSLRRFRDESLARSTAGRAAIRVYYVLSPPAARYFANITPLRWVSRHLLDAVVRRLDR